MEKHELRSGAEKTLMGCRDRRWVMMPERKMGVTAQRTL